MAKKGIILNEDDILKIFVFTMEGYIQCTEYFSKIEETSAENSYIKNQMLLLSIRKYEANGDPMYLRKVLEAAKTKCSRQEQEVAITKLIKELDSIEASVIDIYLSDGTRRSLHEAIEDVMYGIYLHADKNKIENLLKTNMSTYYVALEKYVSMWNKLLLDTYDVLKDLVENKYEKTLFAKASVVFDGTDAEQEQAIKSVPFWSNLRGRDIDKDEVELVIKNMTDEDSNILYLVNEFVEELKKEEFSVKKLNKMVYPVTREYWGDFAKIRQEIAPYEWGRSSKIRYDRETSTARVVLFKNFNPEGAFVIDQLQYSEDIRYLYLKKDNDRAGWRIASYNEDPNTRIKSITIDPNKLIQKISKVFKK